MVKRRFPRLARVSRVRAGRALQPARELRHVFHTTHLIERFLEQLAPAASVSIPALAKALTPSGRGGGPLSITIGATVELEDLDEVSNETVDGLESDIHEIMQNIIINTVAEAKSLVPVRTGTLRDAISGEADEEALMITFKADTSYAVYVEDGTSRMSPSPYLRQPAADAENDLNSQIDDAITDNLDGQVDGDPDSPTVDLEIETTYEGFSESQLAELAGMLA